MRSVVTEAKFTKRYRLEEYEHEEYSLSAVVDEKESGANVLSELKKQVGQAFSGEVEAEEKPAEKKAAKKSEKKEEKKDAKSSKNNPVNNDAEDDEHSSDEDAGNDGEGVEDDEAPDSEDSDSGDGDAEGDEDSDDGDKKQASKASKASKPEDTKKIGGKKLRQKAQAYSRGIEEHKKIFGGVLGSVSPDWKKSDKTKALAKKASEEMEGENFLDENGEVLSQFKVLVARLMKGKTK